jgi:hypothetical protein
MFHFLSYSGFEILCLAIFFVGIGFWSFRYSGNKPSTKTAMLIILSGFILTTASIAVQGTRIGGTLISRHFGWPHEYIFQTGNEEFVADFTNTMIHVKPLYAAVNLMFYIGLSCAVVGATRLWKNKRVVAIMILLSIIVIFWLMNFWVRTPRSSPIPQTPTSTTFSP